MFVCVVCVVCVCVCVCGACRHFYLHAHSPIPLSHIHSVINAYVHGLAWVMRYYYEGTPSWTWYYPYNYAPLAQDILDPASVKVQFDVGVPFKPFEQLLAVLPPHRYVSRACGCIQPWCVVWCALMWML